MIQGQIKSLTAVVPRRSKGKKDVQSGIVSEISLSKRELEIFKLIITGSRTKDISNELNIDVQTVNTHRRRIMQKCKTKNMVAALAYCVRNRIITMEILNEVLNCNGRDELLRPNIINNARNL